MVTSKIHKNCTTDLTFQLTQPKDKMIHHDIPVRPWGVIGADMFTPIISINFEL